MKKLLIGACVAALVSSTASATRFTFTDALDHSTDNRSSGFVTGSFDGDLDASGLITNLSNAKFSINGTDASGPLYILRNGCGTNGFCNDGAAVASLDGSQNNFVFTDADFSKAGTSYTQVFYSLTSSNGGDLGVFTRWTAAYYNDVGTHFRAQVLDVPEPASWAMMLAGFGAIGGTMRSRRKAAVSFA